MRQRYGVMDARMRFERTCTAVKRLNEVKLLIMYDCSDWMPEGVKASGETSDPTANTAIRNVDEIAEKLNALRAEESELESFIGESLAIIQGVRVGFGEVYANLLEKRYIDGLTWTKIHEAIGIPRSTAHYLLGIALDWVDSVGVSRILNGDTEL